MLAEPREIITWSAASISTHSNSTFTAAAADLRAYVFQHRNFVVSMQTIAIQRAAEIVGSGDEKLPEHVGLPGCERFGIDGVNVGIGEQAEALQTFLVDDGVGEGRDGGGIKNVAALDGGGHVEVMLDQKVNFGGF